MAEEVPDDARVPDGDDEYNEVFDDVDKGKVSHLKRKTKTAHWFVLQRSLSSRASSTLTFVWWL